MAAIDAIANLVVGADVRAKLNEVIARVNGLSPLTALQVGTATDYLDIGADGTLRVAGAATAWGISTILFAKLTLTLSAGASCLLSVFDLHGEIDSLGSALEYTKDNP